MRGDPGTKSSFRLSDMRPFPVSDRFMLQDYHPGTVPAIWAQDGFMEIWLTGGTPAIFLFAAAYP